MEPNPASSVKPAAPTTPLAQLIAATCLAPGWQSSELYLALGAIVLIVGLLCAGKIDQTCATALLGAVFTSYPAARSWVKARHLDAVAGLLASRDGVLAQAFARAAEAAAEPASPIPTISIKTDLSANQPPGSGAGVGPKAALALLALGALFLSGCAQTVLYSPRTGQRLASFQGDMTGSHYHGGGVTWDVQQVSHSAATLAGGQSFKMGADSVGTSVVSGIMAGGLPWTKAVAGGTQILAPVLQTAAPVVLQSKH